MNLHGLGNVRNGWKFIRWKGFVRNNVEQQIHRIDVEKLHIHEGNSASKNLFDRLTCPDEIDFHDGVPVAIVCLAGQSPINPKLIHLLNGDLK